MTATRSVLHELVLPKLDCIRKLADGYTARCPAHEDTSPSLSIKAGSTQPVVFHCLAGETRVITKAGTRTLAELAGEKHELLVPKGTGGPAVWQVAPIESFGVQPLLAVTLRRFNTEKVIFATAEHRWFAQKRNSALTAEVKTADLQTGMRLKSVCGRRTVKTPAPFGVAHGFTYGDGYAHKYGASAYFNGDKDAALLSYFPHANVFDIKGKERVRRVDGLPKFFKATPAITESPEYLYGWLAGYFAADGSIEGPDGPAVISSASRESLQFVRDVCTRLGIVTYPIQTQHRNGYGDSPSILFKVTLRPLDLDAEFFVLPSHRERWQQRSPATSYDTWHVVSVTPTDRVEEVFCATVEGAHAFALEDNILTGNCHAGCSQDAILTALGLTWEDISAPREDRPRDTDEWTPAGPASAVYDYRDEHGELLFQVLRVPQPGGTKSFRQRVPDVTAKSGWRWSLGDTRRVPYRLPEVLTAVAEGRDVWIVEGEKDVHTLARMGVTATCNPGGAGKWRPEYSPHFAEAHVWIIADKDTPGQAHARQVAEMLDAVAATVTIAEPAIGKDITDHFEAGHSATDVVITWQQETPAPIDLAPDLHQFLAVTDPPRTWVIPSLLERGDRLIWTGFEGTGKTVVIRQIAVAAAAGVHPFTNERFTPQRVLYIDCENSERQGRRHFRGLEQTARQKLRPVPPDGMFLIHRPAGIDLSRTADAAWLLERVTAHKPDLLVCGPFYRLHAADSEEESAARRVVVALDAARVHADCALIVEHHAPHGGGNGGARALRPFGSSLLMRWPEMGMGIAPALEETPCRHVNVKPWRGNRDERHWPKALQWGSEPDDWPWVDPKMDRAKGSW